MEHYAEQVSQTRLFGQFEGLVNRAGVTKADITKLKQLVLDVADAVGPHLDRIRDTFWQYTEHDLRHLCNVADLVFRFLPKQTPSSGTGDPSGETIRLNAVELAFLWLGILLHDVGMYVSDEEKQATLDSAAYREYLRHQAERVAAAEEARGAGLKRKARAIEDALLAEYFRRLHPQRVRRYLQDILTPKVALDLYGTTLIDDIADLCESHAWGVRDSNDPRDADKTVSRLPRDRRIKSFRVNLQYLACCLRLGDILDFDKSRTPLSVYEQIDFTEEVSIQEWNKHLSIDGWAVDPQRVLFDGACTHPAYYVAVHEFLNWVDDELRECRYLLDEVPAGDEEKYALHLAHLVDRRQVRMRNKKYVAGGFRFRLEYEEIMQLLMDKGLYPDPALFLRELLQNSLDACRYQEALAREADMEDKYIPRITVWDYSEDQQAPRIVFQDNGIGMSQRQIESYFLRVGKSFYRSPEFAAEKQRLEEKKIYLDACSQFGIGFLSCFLAGDLIEVETYRFGNDPLKVTITGPSKYFLIERLARHGDAVRFKSPEDEGDDGPPRFPGTRVTVRLKEGWREKPEEEKRGVVQTTLEAFAVNQEYDIVIRAMESPVRRVVGKRRWEAEPPAFCGCGTSPVTGAIFEEAMVPGVFDLSEYSSQLRGLGAVWLFGDTEGQPCPSKGGLSISSSGDFVRGCEIVVGAPELRFFSGIVDHGRKVVDRGEWADLVDRIVSDADGVLELDSSSWVRRELLALYSELSKEQIGWLRRRVDVMKALPTGRRIFYGWQGEERAIQALLKGDLDELIDYYVAEGLSGLSDAVGFSSEYCLGLFGVNAPACFLLWDPVNGESSRHSFLPPSVSVRIDAYGRLAPQPSASRLFVPSEHSEAIQAAVGRAILRYAAGLYRDHSENADWKRWYLAFLSGCHGVADACLQETPLIADHLEIPCVIDGKLVALTLRAAVERFGDSAPGVELPHAGVDGIVLNYFDWFVEHLGTISAGKEKRVDLSVIQSRLQASGRV